MIADAASLLSRLQGTHGNLALALAERPAAIADARPRGLTDVDPDVLDALLLPGAVVELCALPGAGAATLALSCMKEALARSLAIAGGQARAWLGAIDPERRLCAPAVLGLGLPLSRLVVLAPPAAAAPRVAVRATKSGAFCALLVDATGLPSLDVLPVPIRRMTLAAEDAQATVFLLTSPRSRRTLALPTAVRAEIEPDDRDVLVRFVRHKHGLRDPRRFARRAAPVARSFAEAAA